MSDTVKLIVMISKHQYEICKQAVKDFGDRPITECDFAIAVGTPLDDVKAEIRAEQGKYSHPLEIERAIEILDRIGKESEDT